MDTFWGCDPIDLDTFTDDIDERIDVLRDLIDLLRSTSASVEWSGPDADAHRARTTAVTTDMAGTCDLLAARRALLAEHREAQEAASAAEGGGFSDPFAAVRAEGPIALGGRLRSKIGVDDLGPIVGGPMAWDPLGRGGVAPGPLGDPDLRERVEEAQRTIAETVEKVWPMIGGPMGNPLPEWPDMPDLPPLPEPEEGLPAPVPGDAPFALDPSRLEDASAFRKVLLGQVPGVGQVQSLATLHEGADDVADGVESGLRAAGLEEATPLVGLARVPNDLLGAVIGESSPYSQVTGAQAAEIANVGQASAEMAAELGEGDVGGVFRGAERGMYRHVGSGLDMLAATPVPGVYDAAEAVSGRGADVMDAVSPGSGEGLREFSTVMGGASEHWQADVDRLTDTERLYRWRVENAPLPGERRSA